MLWGCISAEETGALHKIDGIMGKEPGATSEDISKIKSLGVTITKL